MKLATIVRRLVHRIVTPGLWILAGSLALAGTSQASAAFAARPSACAPAATCGIAGVPVSNVIINTGAPDGRMAIAARLEGHSLIEIEAADDFSVTTGVRIVQATITGLLPTGALTSTIEDVDLEIYRIFPLDSNTSRTIQVPTRANSPSDVDFGERAFSEGNLIFTTTVLNPGFIALNSVLNGIHPKPNQTTGGEGPVTGEEVQINITLHVPFTLAPGHYFFIPKLELSSGTWYWLSAAGPASFPVDLQAWIRNSNLDPDWLRIGTDIVGGGTPPKFNASFSLSTGHEIFLPQAQR